MPLLEWSDAYSVNIAAIDEQHKGLVDLINQLHSAMLRRQSGEVLGAILDELGTYVERHLSYEEELLRRYDFPGLAEHEAKHRDLRERVSEFRKDHASGRMVPTTALIDFLRKWLSEHILGTDRLYADFLNSEGVF